MPNYKDRGFQVQGEHGSVSASALVTSYSILCTEIGTAIKKPTRITHSALYIYVPDFLEIFVSISE